MTAWQGGSTPLLITTSSLVMQSINRRSSTLNQEDVKMTFLEQKKERNCLIGRKRKIHAFFTHITVYYHFIVDEQPSFLKMMWNIETNIGWGLPCLPWGFQAVWARGQLGKRSRRKGCTSARTWGIAWKTFFLALVLGFRDSTESTLQRRKSECYAAVRIKNEMIDWSPVLCQIPVYADLGAQEWTRVTSPAACTVLRA